MAALQGRIALVTGASQGIGRACALELARAGVTVALAEEIAAAGGQAAAFTLDVASEESLNSGAKAVLERFGKVRVQNVIPVGALHAHHEAVAGDAGVVDEDFDLTEALKDGLRA